jgi:hypothetical protein
MNENRDKALDVINRSIAVAESRGYRLKQRTTLGAKFCCPLGAVTLAEGIAERWSGLSAKRREEVRGKTMVALGLPDYEAADFARGFDGKQGTHDNSATWALGRRVGIERGLIKVKP